jgi:hypothetical protein
MCAPPFFLGIETRVQPCRSLGEEVGPGRYLKWNRAVSETERDSFRIARHPSVHMDRIALLR